MRHLIGLRLQRLQVVGDILQLFFQVATLAAGRDPHTGDEERVLAAMTPTLQTPLNLQLCDLGPLLRSLQLTLEDHQFAGNLPRDTQNESAKQHVTESLVELMWVCSWTRREPLAGTATIPQTSRYVIYGAKVGPAANALYFLCSGIFP